MMSGIVIVKNVQQIQVVLKCVKYLDSGTKYIGIGAATEIKAIIEMVTGNPNVFGHLYQLASSTLRFRAGFEHTN